MMIIDFEKESDSFNWHVGTGLPPLEKDCFVIQIQADGNELELILDHFDHLPSTGETVQIWFGDLAHYIYLNLSLKHKGNQKSLNLIR